jgi:hypothetical protein
MTLVLGMPRLGMPRLSRPLPMISAPKTAPLKTFHPKAALLSMTAVAARQPHRRASLTIHTTVTAGCT